jgi:hypothetical protein
VFGKSRAGLICLRIGTSDGSSEYIT